MKEAPYDLIIVGAGCYGTSLASQLLEKTPALKLLLVDERAHFRQEQRWCFWQHQNEETPPGQTKSWSAWSFQRDGRRNLYRATEWSYTHIYAPLFFKLSHQRLKSHGWNILTNAPVTQINSRRGMHAVHLADGQIFHSKRVIDSRARISQRPTSPINPGEGWWQSFYGEILEIISSDQGFTLMDIDDDLGYPLSFGYILPLKDKRTLVEYTVFSKDPLDISKLRALLSGYKKRLGIARGVSFGFEQGWLPMLRHRRTPLLGHHRGANYGTIRPASGYAFARIQKQASADATAISNDTAVSQKLGFYDHLDSVFLTTLSSRPELVADAFEKLMSALTGDELASFMAEKASASTLIKVISVLPKLPFLEGAIDYLSELVRPHDASTLPAPEVALPRPL
ncbi:MAG: lycopene cyclase family protein [Verrucomicrobiales bacterium]